MKIITRSVIDVATGKVESEESFEYQGPIAHCGKGGGGTQTSVSSSTPDYAFNARMATVSEKEQNIADQYFTYWKDTYAPMETAQVAANMSLIPEQTKAELSKTQLEGQQAEAAKTLLPGQTEVAQGILENKAAENKAAAPVMSEYYKQALSGIDPNKKVNEARADVAQSFKGSEGALTREAGRLGIDPSSSRFAEAMAGRGLQQAKATAGAMTTARNTAEQQNFARLSEATNKYKGGIGG